MATVVNRSQHVVTGGMSPKATYSRVVSVDVSLEPDGVWVHGISSSIGQSFWLLRIDVWLCPKVVNQNQWTEFEIRYGQADIPNPGRLEEWEKIVPVEDQTKILIPWRGYDGRDNYSWCMNRRYVGQAGRLAIVGMRAVNWGEDHLQASFEISEG